MIELVEKVFNVLERNTGAGDPVDMVSFPLSLRVPLSPYPRLLQTSSCRN
jgi:hypothetical protein